MALLQVPGHRDAEVIYLLSTLYCNSLGTVQYNIAEREDQHWRMVNHLGLRFFWRVIILRWEVR